METARHGSELRGLADVDRSSLANGRFGRLFAGCDPAKHSERVLNELAKTMIQGEFQTRRDEGEEKLDHPLHEFEEEDENRTIPARLHVSRAVHRPRHYFLRNCQTLPTFAHLHSET